MSMQEKTQKGYYIKRDSTDLDILGNVIRQRNKEAAGNKRKQRKTKREVSGGNLRACVYL